MTDEDAPEVLQPGEQAFDLPTSPVASQRSTILRRGFDSVETMRCNQLDVLFGQLRIEFVTVIGKVADQTGRF
jgi:hypothetical protein